MKQSTAFQRLRFALWREIQSAKQNPVIFTAALVKYAVGFWCGYGILSLFVITMLALFAVPSCKKVNPEVFWEDAYKRGYAEKFYTPNGEPAYRWKEVEKK